MSVMYFEGILCVMVATVRVLVPWHGPTCRAHMECVLSMCLSAGCVRKGCWGSVTDGPYSLCHAT
jgi:hypothetical protein